MELTPSYAVLARAARAETARVALQFGIGYLPLSVVQARGLWEARQGGRGRSACRAAGLADGVHEGPADAVLRSLRDRVRARLPAEARLDHARTLSRAGRMAEALAIWTPLAGAGVAQDAAEARRWADAAAQHGVAAAAARLGTMCHDAAGGPRDPPEAVR